MEEEENRWMKKGTGGRKKGTGREKGTGGVRREPVEEEGNKRKIVSTLHSKYKDFHTQVKQ